MHARKGARGTKGEDGIKHEVAEITEVEPEGNPDFEQESS
jgi:hypothetical protein